jgi:flagellin
MVITNTSTASLLSNIYSSNADSLSASLSKLASGKRVQNPGDDFAAYIRASGLNTAITGYQNVRQDLQNAKGMTDYAAGVGNAVMEDLTRMQELQDLYNGTTDTDKQTAYSTEYDTVMARVTNTMTNSVYDGASVYATGSLGAFNVDPAGTGSIDVNASDTADVSAFANIANDAIGAELTAAQTYVAEMNSYGTEISRAMKLNDTVVSGKQATVSALINVDEIQEMAKVTNLQVRQQATVSMMSQANVSQAALSRLFS